MLDLAFPISAQESNVVITMSDSKRQQLCQVIPRLWIGTVAALEGDVLQSICASGQVMGIKYVVNLSGLPVVPAENITIHNVCVNDVELMDNEYGRTIQRVQAAADKVSEYMLQSQQGGHFDILLCCERCVNQAPLVAAYYLVKYESMTAAAAIKKVSDANESRALIGAAVQTLTNKSFRKIIEAAAANRK